MSVIDHQGPLSVSVAGRWWVVLLRGILALGFGILGFAWPALTLFTLVFLLGAYVLADGMMSLAVGVSSSGKDRHWWVMVLAGLVSIAAGIVTFLYPGVTAVALLSIIALAAILRGILEIVAGIRLRKEIEGELWLVLGGLLSIGVGVVLLTRPGWGALTLSMLVGAYAIAFGAVSVLLSLRLRGLKTRLAGFDRHYGRRFAY